MYIHADMPGSGTLLLALDGVVVDLVVEADTRKGWLRRFDTKELDLVSTWSPTSSTVENLARLEAVRERAQRIARCPIVRVEGKVDFVGDTAADPDWMISQRLAAIRIRHGLPIDVSVGHDTSGMAASVLERLAAQLRVGSMVAVNLREARACDRFPLPDGKCEFQPTGQMSLVVDYRSPDTVKAYEVAKAEGSRQHPGLVAEHVCSLTQEEATR